MRATKSASQTKSVSGDLTQAAQQIAVEVARREKKTTLRLLLKRCGYEKRNAQTVRRVAAALDAVGVQCLPPPAGVDDLDAPLKLASAAPRKTGSSSKVSKKTTTSSRSPRKTARFASREEMLAYAQHATVLVKLDDGHGSGLIIDKSGLVLTARHVIESSEAVCLRYEDGTETQGQVIFSDTALDYAFVQGEPRPEFFNLRGDSKLAVGQTVYAVGTPLQTDLAGSVSRGIISGLDRVIGGVTYIQTDATIHAGHSGGPLVTEDGEVAGVNLWGRPEEGIRFALPIPYVLEALSVLKPQLKDLPARLYCTACGFLNGPENWLMCSSWLCCGHCGTVLGDLKANALQNNGACEDDEGEEVIADKKQAKKQDEVKS